MRTTKSPQSRDQAVHAANVPTHRLNVLHGVLFRRFSLFVLFQLLYGAIFSTHFTQFAAFALEQDNYPHFALILTVSLYLLYIRRQQIFAHVEYCAHGGIPLILLGVVLYVLGLILHSGLSRNDFMTLTILGTITVWVGGFLLFCGLPAARQALFPLGFLFFMVPPPEILLSHMITALQYASAEMTYGLFKLIAFPVFRDGTYFALPGLTIEVVRECSSIRSSTALLISSVLLNHLFLRRWWSKMVVWLLVFPLAVFKNGVRIVTLSLLTIYVDERFMHSSLHSRGGAVFFALAFAILGLILLGLRKLEARHTGAVRNAPLQTL